jgi:hypothetical protein
VGGAGICGTEPTTTTAPATTTTLLDAAKLLAAAYSQWPATCACASPIIVGSSLCDWLKHHMRSVVSDDEEDELANAADACVAKN